MARDFETRLRTHAPAFCASAAAIIAAQAAYTWAGPWVLLFVPPLYLVYHSGKIYAERLRQYADQVHQDTRRIQELNTLNRTLASSLTRTVDGPESGEGIGLGVRQLACDLARAAGMPVAEIDLLATAVLLQDARGLGTEADGGPVLNENGRGAAEASPLGELVLGQHERWDGLGYPRGLSGEQIPVGARILAIVGMFDLLTTARAYRRAMSSDEALGILRAGAGKQFDPRLVELFAGVVGQSGN